MAPRSFTGSVDIPAHLRSMLVALVAVALLGSVLAESASSAAPTAPAASSQNSQAVWTRQFGSNRSDYVGDIAVSSSGAVYVAGQTGGALPGQTNNGAGDIFVRKYGPGGSKLWTRQFGSPDYEQREVALAVDARGALYVVGQTYGTIPGQTSAGGGDAFVRKYAPGGAELWTRQFGSKGHDWADDVAVTRSGAILVTGYAPRRLAGQNGSISKGTFARKYTPDGRLLWTRRLSRGSGTTTVMPRGVVYVATSVSPRNSIRHTIVRKFGPDGSLRWTHRLGRGSQQFGTRALSEDRAGNVLVTGTTTRGVYAVGTPSGGRSVHPSVGGGWDAFLRKLSRDGRTIWTRQFDVGEWDDAWGLDIDKSGSIYIAGPVAGTFPGQTKAGGDDAYVRKYGSGGRLLWTRQFGSSRDDAALAVSVNASGGVMVAGLTYGAFPGAEKRGQGDAFVRKYRQR